MDLIPTDAVGVLYALLPGFLAAWVFYGLTAHPKPSAFERTVQALVFTAVIRVIVIVLRALLLLIGKWKTVCEWSADLEMVLAVTIAIAIGLVWSRWMNNDTIHALLRRWRWTRRTSHPSEWYSAFSTEPRWVVLHLSGGRRLYGWPLEWPDSPDHGHFVMNQAEWLTEDGKHIVLTETQGLLIPAEEVEMVDFLAYNEERLHQNENRADKGVDAVIEETINGSQSSTTSAE